MYRARRRLLVSEKSVLRNIFNALFKFCTVFRDLFHDCLFFRETRERKKSVPFIFVVDGGKKPISVKLMLSVPLEWGITTMRDVPRPISRFWKVNNFSAS